MSLAKGKSIVNGFRQSGKITKQHSKSFYFASKFLPRKKRYASYTVYAICRICDNAVDNSPQQDRVKDLTQIQERIDAAYSENPVKDEILLAFRQTVQEYRIPKTLFDTLVDGMRMDLTKTRYENFDELHHYSYKAAGVIGLIMLKIFGCQDPEAEKHAISLGIALQLTNILRDIKEDYALGRIYLPQAEMALYGITEETISRQDMNEDFIRFMEFQIKRARRYYQESAPGIALISGFRSHFVICLIKDIYAGILTVIERNGYQVFKKRAKVSFWAKVATAIKVLFKREYAS